MSRNRGKLVDDWCEANGHTEPEWIYPHWWAYPPGGVMRVPIQYSALSWPRGVPAALTLQLADVRIMTTTLLGGDIPPLIEASWTGGPLGPVTRLVGGRVEFYEKETLDCSGIITLLQFRERAYRRASQGSKSPYLLEYELSARQIEN